MDKLFYLGADPSLRHVGLALVNGGSATLSINTINTGSLDILSSVRHIRSELEIWLRTRGVEPGTPFILGIEKQIRTGWNVGGLFAAQVAVLDAVEAYFKPTQPWAIFPFPMQLKSYMLQRHGVKNWRDKKEIIARVRSILDYEGPLTEHEADAYFIAHLAREVVDGTWRFDETIKRANTPLLPVTAMWRRNG